MKSKLAKIFKTERYDLGIINENIPLIGAQVIMCSEYNWKGECIAMTVPLEYNSCTSLKDPWYKTFLALPLTARITTLSSDSSPIYSVTLSATDMLIPYRAYNVSSLSPVPGTVCWLHNSNNCSDICRSPSGCSKIVQFPGYANLSTYGYPPWTDRMGSFTCSPDRKTFFE